MKLLFKAGSALVSSWSPTGMSKCRLETVRSSRDPAHSGNRMCFAVTFSRSRNYTTKTQIRWCDFTQQQPLFRACNHCLYFPMSVCGSPPSLFFFSFFFSHWQLLLWPFAWSKHSFLSTGSYPHTLGDDVQPCVMYVPVGFIFIISDSALDQEIGGGLRMRLHSFTSMSCRGTRPPWPLDESWLTLLA